MMEATDFAETQETEMKSLRLAASMVRTGILDRCEAYDMVNNLPTIRLECGEENTDRFIDLCDEYACEVEIGNMDAKQARRLLEDKPIEWQNSTLSLIEVLNRGRGKEYLKYLELKNKFE